MAGSLAMFFFPLAKPEADEELRTVKAYWLFKIVMSQLTVAFSVFGVANVIIEKLV